MMRAARQTAHHFRRSGLRAIIGGTIDTSAFAFATDLEDEGINAVLANVMDRAGLDGVALAVAYHQARDVFPHNPFTKVRFLPADEVFFRPDMAAFGSNPLRPVIGEFAQRRDFLAELCTAAAQRMTTVHAWVVFLHNFTLGWSNPDCVSRNAFGDPFLTDLCPANPHVRSYARTLAAEIARYPVSTLLAESLHFHPLEHGFHHERYLIDLQPISRFLLGLCFCSHCLDAATALGVDAAAVQAAVRETLESDFAGDIRADTGPIFKASVGSMADGEMAGYLAAREETVSSLIEDIAVVLASQGIELAFIDASGAVKGYATGLPTGEPVPLMAWQLGIDLPRLSRSSTAIEVLGYASSPDRLRADVEAYRRSVGDQAVLDLVSRPTHPDTDSVTNLTEKLRIARALGVARVDFYHYGLMRLRDLDRIRDAIELSSAVAPSVDR